MTSHEGFPPKNTKKWLLAIFDGSEPRKSIFLLSSYGESVPETAEFSCRGDCARTAGVLATRLPGLARRRMPQNIAKKWRVSLCLLIRGAICCVAREYS